LIQRQTTVGSLPSTIDIRYDGDGNRVTKIAGGVTTHFLVDDLNPSGWPQVLEELSTFDPQTTAPAVTRVYAYGHAPLVQDQLVGASGSDAHWSVSHFAQDAHGNVRFLTDETGHVTDTFDYDAFGSLIARSGTTPTTRLFTGEEFDPDLGLYNLRTRYHNPDSGRFWARDRFEGFTGDPASLHGYTYVQNDPVNRIDPGGQFAMTETMAVSAISVYSRQVAVSLWGGINNYTHGLGGGEALKAQDAVEGQFIQGLSEHVGINLGRQNFFATMQGAPFLLANNPFVFKLRDDCLAYEVVGYDPDAPIYGCPNREPVFTAEESPLLRELMDFGHGSLLGGTLRQLSADYGKMGQEGSGTLGFWANYSHDITSQLLGMAAGLTSPTTIRDLARHVQNRAEMVMADEFSQGSGQFGATLQGLSSLVGDLTGYNGALEASFGVDRATTEQLGWVNRVERGGFGVAQLATLASGTLKVAEEAASLEAATRLKWAKEVELPKTAPEPTIMGQPKPCAGKSSAGSKPFEEFIDDYHVNSTTEPRPPAEETTAITDPARLLPAPRGRNPDLPGGQMVGVELPAGFRFNQAVGSGQSLPGAYGTLANIPDIGFVRNNLAVIPEFKPVISGSRVVEVVRPVRAQFSIIGPQVENGSLYPGGEWQLRILEYDPKNPFVKFVGDEKPLR
jgi:RHS repeat-associated protein